ncbi:MAG: hypothetical protein NVSMB9_20320 [Isosphaeraceae bacterium]
MTDASGRLASTLQRLSSWTRPGASTIVIEQAVYGSFAFRDQGYALLAHSPGCLPGWLADFRVACQNLGERPAGVLDRSGLFALRLPGGPWVVVGVSPQGRDDRGRPGALAFHGLFLGPRQYRAAGHDPFALASALRSDWSAETQSLPALAWNVERPLEPTSEESGHFVDPRAARIVDALTEGRRVALETPEPIDALAREVWRKLPERVRARASVATWAFGNANRFDLLAAPRLAGVALDASYADLSMISPEGLARENQGVVPGIPDLSRRPRVRIALGVGVVLAAAGVGLVLRGGTEVAVPPRIDQATSARSPNAPAPAPGTGDPSALLVDNDVAGDANPTERRRAVESIVSLAAWFGVEIQDRTEPDPRSEPDLTTLMERLARDARYRGPFLSEAERDRLARGGGHDATVALRWDEEVRRFADDRPLPADFRRRSLRGQLVALAWSFHREAEVAGRENGRRGTSEVAHALTEALSVGTTPRPSPLTDLYPALGSYHEFLGRLPRR